MRPECAWTQEERYVRWQQIEQQCRGITDALNEPIDPGIFELVVALNALGLPSTA